METIEIISKEMKNNNTPNFEDLSTEQIRQVIKNFNLHLIINDIEKLSRKSILEICEKMLNINVNGIYLKISNPIIFKKEKNENKNDIYEKIDDLTEQSFNLGNLITEINNIENNITEYEKDGKIIIKNLNIKIGKDILDLKDLKNTRRKAQRLINEKQNKINIEINNLYEKLKL